MSAKAGVRRDPDGIWFDGQVAGNGVGSGGGGGDDILAGYEPLTLNFVTEGKIVTLTVLARSEDTQDVRVFGAADSRLLLQVDTAGKLTVARGYLKA